MKTNKLVQRYYALEGAYDELKVEVRYVQDFFEEVNYVEVVLLADGEEQDNYTLTSDDFTSKARCYNLAQDVLRQLRDLEVNVAYDKHVYR